MSILFFAESQRRKRIHTKDDCLILQRHSQFGKIWKKTNNVKNGVQRGHWPSKTRLNCLSRPPLSSSLLVDCWSQTLIGYHRHLSCPVWEWFTALVYSSQCIPDIFWIWADWWVCWQRDLYSKQNNCYFFLAALNYFFTFLFHRKPLTIIDHWIYTITNVYWMTLSIGP